MKVSPQLATEVSSLMTAQMLPDEPSANHPEREAAFGRGLGMMRLPNGLPLDRRDGVWGWYDAAHRRAEVNIDWVCIPAGPFTHKHIFRGKLERDFLISRHPVTHSQFQAFVDDPGGWAHPQWWGAAPARERKEPWSPKWKYANHPCTDVSWWAAQAYCRWLSSNLGLAISLPHADQWERAEAGTKGTQYPWGSKWSKANSNCHYAFDQTTFSGLYPQGRSEEGVHDLIGNVWEWTCDWRDSIWWWTAIVSPAYKAIFDRKKLGAARTVRGFCFSTYSHVDNMGLHGEWYRCHDRRSTVGFRLVATPSLDP